MTVDSEVGNADSGLDDAAVYISPYVNGRQDMLEQLQQVVPSDGSIGVAVMTEEGLGEATHSYVLNQLFKDHDYDTLIISVDGDLLAASTSIDTDDAMTIANQAETAAAGDTTDALVSTVQQIDELDDSASTGDSHTDGGGLGGLLPVVIAAVVVVAGGSTIAGIVARNRRKSDVDVKGLPAAIRQRTDRLRALRAQYAAFGQQGNQIAAQTAADIDAVVGNTSQLFARLDSKASPAQRTIAEDEYSDKLGRLTAALETDYLLDQLKNPQLWDDPDERVREVREALTSVNTQIVDNIKQVNARTSLAFQVSLDSLVGREELRDWEREFNRGTDS
ncbi:MAG: hypothetical protein QM607_08220 [Microbacterium sp.]